MNGSEQAALEGTGAFVALAAFFRSTWRRWTDRHDTKVAEELKELRHEMRGALRGLSDQVAVAAKETADIKDRVTRLEAVVYDRLERRRSLFGSSSRGR